MNEFYLSDDEIAVLAALMGGDIVYGIESDLFNHWKGLHKDKVQRIMEELMNRQYISISFDQHIYMNPELYEMMDTIVNVRSMLIVDGVYYFKKNKDIYSMSRGEHLYCIKKNNHFFSLQGDSLDINEILNIKDLDVIDCALSSFDEDNAYEYLSKRVNNLEIMIDIIDGNYEGREMEYYEWKEHSILVNEKIEIGIYNQKYFEIYKEFDLIHYNGGLNRSNMYLEKMFGR